MIFWRGSISLSEGATSRWVVFGGWIGKTECSIHSDGVRMGKWHYWQGLLRGMEGQQNGNGCLGWLHASRLHVTFRGISLPQRSALNGYGLLCSPVRIPWYPCGNTYANCEDDPDVPNVKEVIVQALDGERAEVEY